MFSDAYFAIILVMVNKVCENCGKGVMKGHKVSHAKQRTRKFFKPNLHWIRMDAGGHFKKMLLCTKCIKTLKKKNAKKLASLKVEDKKGKKKVKVAKK